MPVLFLTVLIDLIGFGIIIPILPFMAPALGASNFDIALIIAIYSLFGGLVGPFWGKLSDRIGRKPVLLICLAGAALSYVLLAYANTLAMLYAARALAGVMAGNFGVASAMVADISKPHERAKYMGVIGAAFGLGMVVGPFLGGILAGESGNFMRPGLFAAALSTTAILAGLLFLRESLPAAQRAEHAAHRREHGDGGSIRRMLKDSRNTLLAAQYFLNNSCHTVVSYLFPLWVGVYLGWGAKEVGMVFGVLGVSMVILQAGLIGWLVRLMGELRLLLLGASLMITGFAVAALAESQTAILIAFYAAITGGTVSTPVLNALVANRTPAQLRGRMLGTTSSSAAFGRVFGPLLGGVMLSLFGFDIAWFSGTVLALLMASWSLGQLRAARPAAAPVAGQAPQPKAGGNAHGR
jgi:MFS transporter, DHA1 family, tetracycline resistance protein